MLTPVSKFTIYDGTAITNEDRKKIKQEEMLKFTQFAEKANAKTLKKLQEK